MIVAGGAVAAGGATIADFLAEVRGNVPTSADIVIMIPLFSYSSPFCYSSTQVCHPARGESIPQVLVMASSEPGPLLQRILAKRWAQKHVTFLVGSVLVRKDLVRAQADMASMVFILADLAAADPASEDEETVLMSAAVHRFYPKLPMRVLLIRRRAASPAASPSFCFHYWRVATPARHRASGHSSLSSLSGARVCVQGRSQARRERGTAQEGLLRGARARTARHGARRPLPGRARAALQPGAGRAPTRAAQQDRAVGSRGVCSRASLHLTPPPTPLPPPPPPRRPPLRASSALPGALQARE